MRISDWSSDVCSSDLGIVGHVTLIEYDSQLRADAVLQRKLGSLANVKVITSALTTEVSGDGNRLTGLTYKDRERGTERSEEHTSELQSLMRISYAVFCLKKKKK